LVGNDVCGYAILILLFPREGFGQQHNRNGVEKTLLSGNSLLAKETVPELQIVSKANVETYEPENVIKGSVNSALILHRESLAGDLPEVTEEAEWRVQEFSGRFKVLFEISCILGKRKLEMLRKGEVKILAQGHHFTQGARVVKA
jgi:hypothetical protein